MKTYIEISLSVILTAIVTALLVLVTVVPLLLWNAVVFYILWGWFIVPLGLPVLTAGQCVGILLVKSIVFAKYSKSDEGNLWSRLGAGIFGPLMILSVAAFFHFFII